MSRNQTKTVTMNKELKKLEKVFQERDELATKNRELEARLQAVLPLEPLLKAKELGEKLKELAAYHQKVETALGVHDVRLERHFNGSFYVSTSFEPSQPWKSSSLPIIRLEPERIPNDTERLSAAVREATQRQAEIKTIQTELGPFREIILELADWLRVPETKES